MYAMPVFDMAEDLCRRKNIKNKLFTRVFVRSLFVVFTAFIGITLPFFGGEFAMSRRRLLLQRIPVGSADVNWSVSN